MNRTRADDLEIPEPIEALRYLQFRSENRIGRWSNVRSINGRVLLSLQVHPEDAETPTRFELLVACRGESPAAAQRYRVDQALKQLNLTAVATEELQDSVRMWLTHSTPPAE